MSISTCDVAFFSPASRDVEVIVSLQGNCVCIQIDHAMVSLPDCKDRDAANMMAGVIIACIPTARLRTDED